MLPISTRMNISRVNLKALMVNRTIFDASSTDMFCYWSAYLCNTKRGCHTYMHCIALHCIAYIHRYTYMIGYSHWDEVGSLSSFSSRSHSFKVSGFFWVLRAMLPKSHDARWGITSSRFHGVSHQQEYHPNFHPISSLQDLHPKAPSSRKPHHGNHGIKELETSTGIVFIDMCASTPIHIRALEHVCIYTYRHIYI